MKNKRKILTIVLTSVISLILCLAIVSVFSTKSGKRILSGGQSSEAETEKFSGQVSHYVGSQNEINPSASNTATSTTAISMNELYTISGDTITATSKTVTSSNVITITTPEELYAFSVLCNSNAKYLGYKYKLFTNIDYSVYGESHKFIPVGWKTGEPFSGTFDGNGYEINELKMIELTNENSLAYSSMENFAMFSKNTGAIQNLGLISPSIVINASTIMSRLQSVSYLVGINVGTVEYTYVRDFLDPIEDEAGIVVAGQVAVSGLVYTNTGKLKNSYTAVNIVISHSVINMGYLSSQNIVAINSGETENLFFYDKSIETYSYDGSIEKIAYKPGLIPFNGKYTVTADLKYQDTLLKLNNAVAASSSKWYISSSYGDDLKSSLNIETPILRGLDYDASTKTFDVYDEYDYMYMYELMNMSAMFASNKITYQIMEDIYLKNVPTTSYKYDSYIGCTIKGKEKDGRTTVYDMNGVASKYPTIFDATVMNKVTTTGIDCYGVFPWLTGTVSNLNIYQTADVKNFNSNQSNIKAIGVVSGFVEKGTVSNVNVYANVDLTGVDRYFAGTAVGVLSGQGTLNGVTTSGSIDAGEGHSTDKSTIYTNTSGFIEGNALGGILGFSDGTFCNLDTLLNGATVTVGKFASSTNIYQSVGGVVGAAYTNNCKNLENKGNIIAGSSTDNNIGRVYTAGCIGRLLGVTKEIQNIHNQGDITIYNIADGYTYVSGAINADVQTTQTQTPASQLKKLSKFMFYASGVSSSGTLSITTYNKRAEYAGVMNIISKNGFQSELSGIYNLGYKYSASGSKVFMNTPQTLNLHYVHKYAGVINNVGTNNSHSVNAKSVYNFRDVKYISNNAEINQLDVAYKLAGVIVGQYYNLEGIYNEGGITFDISNKFNTCADGIVVSGICQEISAGFKASGLYNNGDIIFDCDKAASCDLFFNGICYKVENGLTDVELDQYNPSSSSYNNKKVGVLDKAINNGQIKITNSTAFGSISYGNTTVTSSNGGQTIGNRYTMQNAPTRYFEKNVNVSGITYLNKSVITNTFNLGNVFGANYIKSTTTKMEVNAAGISVLNVGKYAYILNCANNGSILAANMSGATGTNEKGLVVAAGISAKNNKTEANADYTTNNGHSKQLISYSINYGDVIAYNNIDNITSSDYDPTSISAGILGVGLCNIMNTTNYGNIYGNETGSGIFGVVYFKDFKNEVTSNATSVSLANSINYGNVWQIEKGENNFKDSTSVRPRYTNIVSFASGTFGTFTKAKIELEYGNTTFTGSIFALVNFNGSSNAQYVKIRYLINFLDYIPFVGAESSTPDSTVVDTTKMYSAYLLYENGYNKVDKYLNTNMVYSPLTTGKKQVISSKDNKTDYWGVFNENFAFYKAINGEGLDASYATDSFLADYFQFVGYTKINDVLLDKIGWRAIAYSTAANDFAQNLEYVNIFVNKYNTLNSSQYSANVTTALNTGAWVSNLSSDNADALIAELFKTVSDVNTLKATIKYIFSDDCAENVYITTQLRQAIAQYILNTDATIITGSELLNFSTADGYCEVLADVLTSTTDNEIKTYVKSALNSYISQVNDATVYSLVSSYNDYLISNGAKFFNYADKAQRYNLAVDFFGSIDDDLFYTSLSYALSAEARQAIENADDVSLKLYASYTNLDADGKFILYKNILSTSRDNMEAYVSVMDNELGIYPEFTEQGYNMTNMSSYVDQVKTNSTTISDSTDNATTTARVNLYNDLRTTDTFQKYVKELLGTGRLFYDVAIDTRNTYRSDYEPITDGKYTGDVAYTYATTVTDKTYYYGPYTDANGNKRSAGTTPTVAPSLDGNQGGYKSVFVSDDKDFMDRYVADGYVTDYTPYYYEYGSGASNNQFTSVKILGNYNGSAPYFRGGDTDSSKNFGKKYGYIITDFTGCQMTSLKDVWLVDDAGVEFNARGGVISPYCRQNSTNIVTSQAKYTINRTNYSDSNYYGYFYITDANGVIHYFSTIVGDSTSSRNHTSNHNSKEHDASNLIIGANGTNCTYHGWADLIWNYGKTLYHAYATTKLHSTSYTGLYKNKDGNWWWTNKTSGTRVYTTSYIDYYADDMLTIDGIIGDYYESSGNIVQSLDERRLINRLFNEYFCKSANVNKFRSVVIACLLEKLGTKNNQVNEAFIDSFILTNINTTTKVNNTDAIKYLQCNRGGNVVTLYEYLMSTYITNDKNKLIQAYSSNKTVFQEVNQIIINGSKLTQAEYEEYFGYGTAINKILANPSAYLDANGQFNKSDFDATFSNLFNNITAATGVNIVTNTKFTAPNQYAISFDTNGSITLKLTGKETKLTIVTASSNNATGTMTFAYNAGGTISRGLTNRVTSTTTAAARTSYEYTLSNVTTLTISGSANLTINDIYSYAVETTETIIPHAGTDTLQYTKNTYNQRTTTSFTVPTLAEFAADIEANNGHSGVTISGAEISVSVYNYKTSTYYYSLVAEVTWGTKLLENQSMSRRSTVQSGYVDVSSYYGKPMYILSSNNAWYQGDQTTDVSVTAVRYKVTYGYSYNEIVTNTKEITLHYFNDGSTLAEAKDRLDNNYNPFANIDSEKIDFYGINGVTGKYAQACISKMNTNNFLRDLLVYFIPLTGNTSDVTALQNAMKADNTLLLKLAGYSNKTMNIVFDEFTDPQMIQTILSDELIDENVMFFSSIITYLKNNSAAKLTDKFKALLLSAYLATDYANIYSESLLNTSVNVSQTKFANILNTSFDSKYRYISNSGTFDFNKFDALMAYLEINTSASGYGIYALASSQGIKNGTFLPDNLTLSSMDVDYKITSNGPELISAVSSSWRGGKGETTDAQKNDVSDTSSVNYGFLVDMKQLKKSISTTVFALDLIATDGSIIYSSESNIDLDNKTITYYVPKGFEYLDGVKIYNSIIANNATLYVNNSTDLTTAFDLSVGENPNIIKVLAEDVTVIANYVLIIEEIDISFDLYESSHATSISIPYTNGTINLTLSSPAAGSVDTEKLPENFDVTPYIYIENKAGTDVFDDYELTTDCVVDENGIASLGFTIFSTLPAGDYNIVVDIYGVVKKVEFTKEASNQAYIVESEFEGKPLTWTSYQATTEIKFGEMFDYDDLTDSSSTNFYLNVLTVSDCATFTISATKALSSSTSLMTYTVSIVVTAEDGTTNTYTHMLREKEAYGGENITYADMYKDGNKAATKTWSSDMDQNKFADSFERGVEPQYQMKYSLSGFYTDGENVEYGITAPEDLAIVTALAQSGFTAVVSDSASAGTYVFNYIYKNTATWTDGEYTREYVFPEVSITKQYSTDALLGKITFLDSAVKLSTLATVMYPTSPVRPGEEKEGNEVLYSFLTESDINNKIHVDSKKINYNGYEGTNPESYIHDYFIVGTVSNANLSNYAPTFKINSYSEIYQYTTLTKLREYGKGKTTTKSDEQILSTHDGVLLYVPFVSGSSEIILLVEYTDSAWGKVYTTDYDGTNAATTLVADSVNEDKSVTYNDTLYNLADYAGNPTENRSLYMDYFGTPVDDHFWYVSYIVLSEDALNNEDSVHFKCYHVALIDLTNTIFFEMEVSTPIAVDLTSIYMNIIVNVYDDQTNEMTTKTIACNLIYDTTEGSVKKFKFEYSIPALPRGYCYFQVSLPGAYTGTFSITSQGKENTNNNTAVEAGAYLPPPSIVMQKIALDIEIIPSAEVNESNWGLSTSDEFLVTLTEKE